MDSVRLRVALVQRGMPLYKLAKLLELRPSTLSDWVRGARPAPADLAGRIERALSLPAGALNGSSPRLDSRLTPDA